MALAARKPGNWARSAQALMGQASRLFGKHEVSSHVRCGNWETANATPAGVPLFLRDGTIMP